jgi:hypothetical protein
MAEDTLTASDVEEVFEGLSQQERLDLLERLIRGETGSGNDAPTTEERIDRLERTTWGEGCGCRRGSGRSGSGGRRGCDCG